MNPVSPSHHRIQQLFGRINYERQSRPSPDDFKLSNMVRLMEQLGNPQFSYPVIHVAGTKGKGSVSAFIGAILQKAGFKTGIYSSPHLERINQRLVFDCRQISDQDLNELLDTMDSKIAEIDRKSESERIRKLTFFEVITAAAFQYFSNCSADAVVLEVGMGGRLDSTNVCQPELSVITNISLDHTRQLGSTIDRIAAEKAGIIKPRRPVVCSSMAPPAKAVIAQIAAQQNSRLWQRGIDFGVSTQSEFAFWMNIADQRVEIADLTCQMIGQHQQENAATAIAAIQVLRSNGWPIDEAHIRAGIRSAVLPGRCEVVAGNPLTILDMAHNPASTRALAHALNNQTDFKRAKKKHLIFAVSQEKDVEAMLEPLLPMFDEVVLTEFQSNPRFRQVNEVLQSADTITKNLEPPPAVRIAETPQSAFYDIASNVNEQDAICVTGSVFLVAELRPLFVKTPD